MARNSPQYTDDEIKHALPLIQDGLRLWFHYEIAEAELSDPNLRGPRWWTWQSGVRCAGCGLKKIRVTIRGHPDGPFYACVACGTIETLLDLTREASTGCSPVR